MKTCKINSTFFFKIIFLIVNLLFLNKYGLRQDIISIGFLIVPFLIITFLLLKFNIFESEIFNSLNLKYLYFTLCIFIFIAILLITIYTDGNNLKVDRWSAMDVAIKALLNCNYPYTATDHMDGRTSNFPGLLILGIPFYLLGNVGYLQSFSFFLLAFTLLKSFKIYEALQFLLLLVISPAYWWEIFSISDLLGNVIIIFCFITLVNHMLKNDIFKYPILLGVSSSLLVLTRGITIIPLIIFIFKPFWKIKIKNQILYLVSFITTFTVLIVTVLINCPDLETLKKFNPFVLQTNYLPTFMILISMLFAFFISFLVKNFYEDFYIYASISILLPILSSFLIFLNIYGIEKIILYSKFDLSYLTIIFPFILVEISKNKSKNV